MSSTLQVDLTMRNEHAYSLLPSLLDELVPRHIRPQLSGPPMPSLMCHMRSVTIN